jgi:RimJ/RimL family protein N-acetyltransferase
MNFFDIKIETERLIIRRFQPGDEDDLYEYLSQAAVVEFEPYGVFTRAETEKEAKERSENEAFFAVCLKENQKVIGNLYFARQEPKKIRTWELGYVFNSDFWGKGYALEACWGILQYAFETLDAHRVAAMCNPENTASWKLLERLGFRREGHLIKNMYFKRDSEGNPIWNDTYIYSMLGVEYLVNHSI